MTELLALGTSHKTAPLALREKLALLDGGAETLIRERTGHPSISEAVALSTCNRTELYLVVSDPVEAESHVLGLLARRAAIRPPSSSAACTRCATATPPATCTG
jgi:glutamyl-tRNA reductase